MSCKIHYDLMSSVVRPKVGLPGNMAFINHATSPYLCFAISLASLIALDPPTIHCLFRKCDQGKCKKLKNESSKAVVGSTKTDSSEITHDPTPNCLRNCCPNELRVACIPKIDIYHRLGHAENNKKEESTTRGDNYLSTLPAEEVDYECT